VASVAAQSVAPVETLVVVDHNPTLLARAQAELTGVRVLANAHAQGLSGARNTAIAAATGEVVVFLDDDARARPGWLAALLEPYEDATVKAVGGAAHPRWPTWPSGGRRPRMLPGARPLDGDATGELDWIIGCTYTGQPAAQAEVRNLMGCNMSFRREVFERVGGFAEDIGRIGRNPLGCEETELCIRARAWRPDGTILYEPAAQVSHRVTTTRATWRYFMSRCIAEGLSKAAVVDSVGASSGLASERDYALRTLPSGVARGVADDKGQLHLHLRATEAILATRGALPVNLKFVFEGEEESSSAHLDAWLRDNRDRLTADFAVISDTGFFEGNIPAITLSLRGIMYAQIDVVGTDVDLHSGGYGGVVQNPANALATIIASLKGPDGRVRIPGFYDDVEPLSDADREAIATLPFDDAAYLERLGLPALVGEVGYSTLERRGTRPTLDVNGLWGGFQGDGSKTIIPAHAHAKVSCRLVAAQDPDRIFEAFKAYVEEIAPPGVTTTVRLLGGGLPIVTPIDHPAAQAAARALEATFGQAPVYIREGGSIPVCASFTSILGHSVVLLGFVQPDAHAHAPNEWMDLGNYETSIRTIARTWDELVDLPR
jgi:acetylornithine deacetylase/succinyl-diaminopimelate desuccinylase-like protein/GT2 family glycosyltransferase